MHYVDASRGDFAGDPRTVGQDEQHRDLCSDEPGEFVCDLDRAGGRRLRRADGCSGETVGFDEGDRTRPQRSKPLIAPDTYPTSGCGLHDDAFPPPAHLDRRGRGGLGQSVEQALESRFGCLDVRLVASAATPICGLGHPSVADLTVWIRADGVHR